LFHLVCEGATQELPAPSLRRAETLEKQLGAFCAPSAGMNSMPQEIQQLTEKIIGCAIEVHRVLGPGLLESVYRECLLIELRREHLSVESERQIALDYKGHRIAGRLRIDLLVNECIVVELKAVDHLQAVCLAQVITYLKITGYPAGLLMNFNCTSLRAGLRRLDHPDLYVKKSRG
jgi:GxxExxY protein